jgi:CHASE3 domain sensor protein
MTLVAISSSVGALRRARHALRTTPGRHRLWSVVTVLFVLVAAIASATSASQLRHSTHRAAHTSGPVLVATQRLLASVAEADAAATAAFLSGSDEDPEQRRLYEEAVARATQQVAEIASLVGDDAAIRRQLDRISVALTQYSGNIEAARASNKAGVPAASTYLTTAVQQADGIVHGSIADLAQQGQHELADDDHDRARTTGLAVAALLVTIILLLLAKVWLTHSTHRLLNLPLLVAIALVVGAVLALSWADHRSGRDIDDARTQGYQSIVTATELASAGFGAKAAETLALVTGDAAQREIADKAAASVASEPLTPQAITAIRNGQSGAPSGLLEHAATDADTPRERAAVADVATRWQRYEDGVAELRAAEDPTAIAKGPLNSAFNGFNFAIGAVLGQNRDQFLDDLRSATHKTDSAPAQTLTLLVFAALFALWGFQLRINDYR